MRKKEFWRGATNLALAALVVNAPVMYNMNRMFDQILSLPEEYSRLLWEKCFKSYLLIIAIVLL